MVKGLWIHVFAAIKISFKWRITSFRMKRYRSLCLGCLRGTLKPLCRSFRLNMWKNESNEVSSLSDIDSKEPNSGKKAVLAFQTTKCLSQAKLALFEMCIYVCNLVRCYRMKGKWINSWNDQKLIKSSKIVKVPLGQVSADYRYHVTASANARKPQS